MVENQFLVHSSSGENQFSGGMMVATFMAIAYLIYWTVRPRQFDQPCPESHFLLGTVPYIQRHITTWIDETCRLSNVVYKRTWSVRLPNIPVVGFMPPVVFVIFDEANMKHILKDNFENYVKGDVIESIFADFLGEAIFTSDGNKWRTHRKLMNSMFSVKLLRYSASIMRLKLQDIIQELKNRIRKLKAPNCADGTDGPHSGEIVRIDVKALFLHLFFDVTSKVAFGVDLDTVSSTTKDLQVQHSFFTAFQEINNCLHDRFREPFFKLKRSLGIGREKRVAEWIRMIDDFTMEFIAERRSNVEKGLHTPTTDFGREEGNFDILTIFLENAKRENDEVSNKDLRDIVVNVLFAGRDTSAATTSWIFYELDRNREILRKLINEVESVCGTGEDANYTYDAMNELKYVHCVILEALRLHPAVPENVRYAVDSDTLPDGTFVPPRAGVALSYCAMGRNADIWGEDVNEFKPERFMGTKEPSPFKYPVFHGGPRICLGKSMAIMNIKLVLSMFFTSGIQFHDKDGHSGDYFIGVVTSMKGAFPMELSMQSERGTS